MTMIVNDLLLRLKDQLKATITDANIVKVGRFQQNPTEQPKYIAISSGNTRNDTTVDGIVTMDDFPNIAARFPGREVGGGSYWFRRGIVDIGCYLGLLDSLTEEEATRMAYDFLGRVQYWTELTKVSDLTDEFGEHAMAIFVYSSLYTEGGGPENQYFYRGQIHWQVLTARAK